MQTVQNLVSFFVNIKNAINNFIEQYQKRYHKTLLNKKTFYTAAIDMSDPQKNLLMEQTARKKAIKAILIMILMVAVGIFFAGII